MPPTGWCTVSAATGMFERMSEDQAASGEPTQDPSSARDPEHAEVLGSPTPEGGAQRDPDEWVTGDEPITGPQRSYLDSLARQAGEEISADLTKAEASEHIERLRDKLGVTD